MKTAMQELINWLSGFENGPIKPTTLRIKEKATELLNKEKEQIIKAYEAGEFNNGMNETAPQYYNKTFNE
jgi:hypothetical protein